MKARLDFIKNSTVGSAVLAIGGILPGFSAKSYGQIIGANEKIRLAVVGVNSCGNKIFKNN
jgi:hypothetical protein